MDEATTLAAPFKLEEKSEGSTTRLEEAATSDTRINVKGVPFEIEFLLMSGNRKRWTVGSEETVSTVRERIFANFPQEWRTSEAPVTSPDSIRLLYLGHFLEPISLLASYNLKPPEEEGQPPSIVHLHIRTLNSSSEQGDKLVKPKPTSSTCRCCIIA
ncbi:hypothetical protein JCM3765_002282 [Sporobolomyces pararoseus]